MEYSMQAGLAPQDDHVGFLTVVRRDDGCHVGGYLILNSLGRPLEFHCTQPVRPNQAQEILYGSTLLPYLYGEQIGATLLAQASRSVRLAFTDVQAVLAARPLVDVPLVYLVPNPDGPQDKCGVRSAQCGVKYPAVTHPRYPQDMDRLHEWTEREEEPYDVAEPLQRIRRAIDELREAA